jgi:glycosyltransferase involved in cell wall biosynthesis
MDVLFLPDFTDGNPYQRLLAKTVSRDDVTVSLASGYPLSTVLTALRTRPDVVHVHWVAPFLTAERRSVGVAKATTFLLAALLTKAVGIDLVWTVHNLLDHERRHPGLELSARRVFARLVDGIIVHCRAGEREVVEQYAVSSAEAVSVVPHGHYGNVYENTIDWEQARAELGVETDGPVFLYFGQIREYKRVPALVDAFRSTAGADARLLVAGKPVDDSSVRLVKSKAAGDSRITTELSFVPDDAVQLYFNAADAAVLPHEDVLTSGSAILAMSFGNPVIAPAVGCLPELLREQDSLLYDPESEDLGDALSRASSTNLADIGDRNYRRVMTFDWDGIAERTRRVYRRL